MPKDWATLSKQLACLNPAAASTVKPPVHDLDAVGVDAVAARWFAATMGYGAAADYGIHWLVSGTPLSAAQIGDLKRLACGRAASIERAYEFAAASAGQPLRIVPRSIYPLIEASEKVSASYLSGCAMAAICVPRAIERRPHSAVNGITYLFHVSLLKAASKAAKRVVVHMRSGRLVDFIGFDTKLGVHLVEAKGSGDDFDTGQLARGIEQCLDVDCIELPSGKVIPSSLNVAATYRGKKPVKCLAVSVSDGLRCAIVEVPHNPGISTALARTSKPPEEDIDQLIGAQALGLYMHLLAAHREGDIQNWSIFAIPGSESPGAGFRVAVPTALFEETRRRFDSALATIRATWMGQRIEQSLDELPNIQVNASDPLEFADGMLVGLGRWVRVEDRWSVFAIPEGYSRGPLEPWLAFEAPAPTAEAVG